MLTPALEITQLKARIRELEDELEESDEVRARMQAILVEVADVLKGEPGELKRHDWSDLAQVARKCYRVPADVWMALGVMIGSTGDIKDLTFVAARQVLNIWITENYYGPGRSLDGRKR